MDQHKNTIEIAVVKEQISGLREQAKSHADNTKEQFDKLGEKVDDLIALMNKGKGAYAASLMFAGTVGAALVSAVSWIISRIN